MKNNPISLGGGFFTLILPLVWNGGNSQPTIPLAVNGTVLRVISSPIPIVISGTSIATSVLWAGREITGNWQSLSISASVGLSSVNGLTTSVSIVVYVGTTPLDNQSARLMDWNDVIVPNNFSAGVSLHVVNDLSGTLYTYQVANGSSPTASDLLVQCYLVKRKSMLVTVANGANVNVFVTTASAFIQAAYATDTFGVKVTGSGAVAFNLTSGTGETSVADTYTAIPWPLNQ